MSTTLRPECRDSDKPQVPDRQVLSATYYAVKKARGLAHGQLRDGPSSCAMGCFWNSRPGTTVSGELLQEVATVNDSVPPTAGKHERRAHVLRWLEWKLGINQ